MNSVGQAATLWFTQQNVDVLWHHDIPVNADSESGTHVLQRVEEQLVGRCMVEPWLSAITAEGYEVDLSGVLETSKSGRHKKRLNRDGMQSVVLAHVSVPKRDANGGHKRSSDTWATSLSSGLTKTTPLLEIHLRTSFFDR